ncbi:transglutaminase domain-containing protein [Phytoactinopolyspora halotolerans]|uniref:Transglutaminase domain-containing protein n=2 Tax=Phytoactinopolyspora halotolerans TaxID=1981512 RepID=A0A6L9SIL0_9ACTN|nr:transglutaminase domain-containing protein [Phytoactinopolyspora halotolerans]
MAQTHVWDWTTHSSYTDPSRHAGLLEAVPADISGLSAVARNVIIHYRASEADLPMATRDDINLRWLSALLDADQARHGMPLPEPRAEVARVQGCCRDHTLFCVAALRQLGIPARSLVGFSNYSGDDYNNDHVIVQTYDGVSDRWIRFDPEIETPPDRLPDPHDIESGKNAPFQTAAEVWQGYRSGGLDPSLFGTGPGSSIGGAWFIRNYVLLQLAHRYSDELLLWDAWGGMSLPGDVEDPEVARLVDEVAEQLVAAEAGDSTVDDALLARYRDDERLHPGTRITQHSPFGDPPVTVNLRTR